MTKQYNTAKNIVSHTEEVKRLIVLAVITAVACGVEKIDYISLVRLCIYGKTRTGRFKEGNTMSGAIFLNGNRVDNLFVGGGASAEAVLDNGQISTTSSFSDIKR